MKKLIAWACTLCILLGCMVMPTGATCSSGIKGNGTSGIYIDINSAPYTTFAQKSYGEYAYGREGCAWFASARVNQLTGKGSTIWSGWSWYYSAYSSLGFSRGSEPRAKALACYENHVAVVEKVDGNTITVSEGGMGGLSDSAHGYCVISTMSRSKLESDRGTGSFYGYVYLGDVPSPTPKMWLENASAPTSVAKGKNETVTGTLKSNNGIKWVWAGIYQGSTVIQEKETTVWDSSFSIDKITASLDFSKLSVGNYRLSIQCMDYDNNYFSPLTKDFSVVIPNMWTESVSCPTTLVPGKNFSVTGMLKSNNGIKWVWVGIYQGSTVVQEKETTVWDSSFSIEKIASSLNFSKLSVGNYRLSIQCMDYDNNYFTPFAKDFSVSSPDILAGSVSCPTTLVPGENFSVTGLLKSNNGIKWAWIGIYQGSSVVQEKETTVWENSFAIEKIASSLNFSKLPAGNYGLSIQCMDYDNNYFTPFAKDFSVKASGLTVTLDPKGGSLPGDSQINPESNSVYGTLPTPTRTGYTFDGWYTEPTGGTQITASTKVTASSDHTLYAHWTKQEQPVVPPGTSTEIHFPKVSAYTQGQFTDVPASQWFTSSVASAVEFGLMKGNSAVTFNPYGDVTLAEAITMASRIHSIYTTGSEAFVQDAGDKWYQVYLDYAYQNGIISQAYYTCDVTQKATRAQFAEIFSNSLPAAGLEVQNTVADNAIPDVPVSAPYAPSVYRLYRAGILTGGDVKGTFSPMTYITRAESATIVARMADSDNRVNFTLT